MTATVRVIRAGPLTSIQDAGRFGMLRHGISASGPMDGGAFAQAGALAGGGHGGIEFTMAGLEIELTRGQCSVGFAGGDFTVRSNGEALAWPGHGALAAGDVLSVTPGSWGNYGYLRFGADMTISPIMGSMATSSRARLGGLDGRVLRAGDEIALVGTVRAGSAAVAAPAEAGPIRVIWGIHADLFAAEVRERFVAGSFVVSPRMDRMGVRLEDDDAIFAGTGNLSLVSDAIMPGDIQILGDGMPIVLMRDHQPTGGYPRIATVISADLDRFAQLRPGSPVAFQPVTVEHAQALLRSRPI